MHGYVKCLIFIKTRRRRKQAEERRLKVVEQERSVKEDIEKSEDKRNRKFNKSFLVIGIKILWRNLMVHII